MKKGAVVVITGASSGIGLALAHKYAQHGASLALCARNANNLNAIAEQIRKQYGIQVLAVPTDVSNEAACVAFIQKTISEFKTIDVLICNAGVSMRAPVLEVKTEVLKAVMDSNFWGAVYCIKAALPYVLKSKGSIVGVSSIAGFRGLPERSGYSASKFALQGFLESLRTELYKTGVHVLTACPGFTATNIRFTALMADGSKQGDSPRQESEMDSAESVADAIFHAIESRKRTLILTRIGKLTVLLNKLLPAWMDKMVYRNFQREKNTSLQ
jgi:short-subunit dehydrogenase